MGEVIEVRFRAVRPEVADLPPLLFNLDVYAHAPDGGLPQVAYSAHLAAPYHDGNEADQLRILISNLDHLTSCISNRLSRIDPDGPGVPISRATVFSDGSASAWVSDRVVTQAEAEWVRNGLHDVARSIVSPSGQISGG